MPTRPSSRSPIFNGPVVAGAPLETPSSRYPLLPALAITGVSPVKRWLPHDYGDEEPAMEQLMYRPVEAAQVLGIGRTRVFALIKSGRLRSVKLGSARFITADALRAFVRDLEQEPSSQADAEVA
jgi:excisionase family DNA binding protein